MPIRYLFGPLSPSASQQSLHRFREDGSCLLFDAAGRADLTIGPANTWESIRARLPPGWFPDFIVLNLAYSTVPEGIWSAPIPLVALADDADLLWHDYRLRLRRCDLVLADVVMANAMGRDGLANVRGINLAGCPASQLDEPASGPRDIDVLFVGNMNPAVHTARLPWLARLGRLSQRWRVAIHSGVFGDAYWQLLRRARVVFNLSRHGECNRRALEAGAAGALLLQEKGNAETAEFFEDGRDCVFYDDKNLETLLERYLNNEDERCAITQCARAVAEQHTFEKQWATAVALVEKELPALREGATRPRVFGTVEILMTRTWQTLATAPTADPTLPANLQAALRTGPESADLHNALGLVLARVAGNRAPDAGAAEAASEHFRRAVATQPSHALARLNLAEALALSGRGAAAVDQARRILALLDDPTESPGLGLDAPHFPPGYDHFRMAWERAAWSNAGDTFAETTDKLRLLRWRVHTLLAELTNDLTHRFEALLACPDLPVGRSALGCALAEAEHPAEAIPHLRLALNANPFDLPAARALYRVLGITGNTDGQQRLASDRRLLSQAAPNAVPLEPWFAQEIPDAMDLVSLVVVCSNALSFTRLCLESVLRHTRSPYELILVDNGSTDSTPAYLSELLTRPGPVRVEILRNAENQGNPSARNQGLARCRGRFVTFLDNDVIVTENWLDAMLAHALRDWPQVGLIGAVSNHAAAPQHVQPGYASPEEMAAFVARRRLDLTGRALTAVRLSGFCLLASRELLQRVGGFDERYGLGMYDDDDLCRRIARAGFRLRVALDVYVHHFGSQTFSALGIDLRKQLETNRAIFLHRWESEELLPEGISVPTEAALETMSAEAGLPPLAPPIRRPRVSLTMIVKNEEANLPACLASVADLVDEIIVVDTGSTDKTKEVAAGYGARVFDFPWCDNFAAARNESLRHATGEWILWLDADDRIDEPNRRRLHELFSSLGDENLAYVMKVRSVVQAAASSTRVLDQVRLFRNHPYVRWQYRVHEQILPAVGQWGGQTRWIEIVIDHTGYQDSTFRHHKLERNLRLLLLEQQEQPEDSFTLFNLGRTYLDLGQTAEALDLFRRSLERSRPNLSIIRKLHSLIAQAHQHLGQRAEALAACRAGLSGYPDDAELLFHLSLLLREEGDTTGAEAALLRLLGSRPGAYFDMVDAGLRGYKARHQLALLYAGLGRTAEAEVYWRVALAERPDFVPAYVGLGDLLLAQSRWDDLDRLATDMEARGKEPTEVGVMRARVYLARKEFGEARRVLDGICAHSPSVLRPRVLLSHALLLEGRDWDATERALRDILAIAPDHLEAKRNLDVLLQRRGQTAAR